MAIDSQKNSVFKFKIIEFDAIWADDLAFNS